MRKRISESNIFPQFSLYDEYLKIEYLISENKVIGTFNQFGKRIPPQYTLEQYINELYFSGWNLRGTFLSITEMRTGLGISKESITKESISEDVFLDFIQYVANVTMQVSLTISTCKVAYIGDKNYTSMIFQNIHLLLEHLGTQLLLDKNTNEVFIAYKDDLGTSVSHTYPEIAGSLSEYKKIDNHGDLKRKGEILCTLFKYLEAEEPKFKGTTYKGLCDDTTFLFNKIGARHWVEKDHIASKTFLTMSPDELELWYDRTYDMFLSCMVIANYLSIKGEIETIKRTV